MTKDEVLDVIFDGKRKVEEQVANLALPIGDQQICFQGRKMSRDQWRKEFGLPPGSWHVQRS